MKVMAVLGFAGACRSDELCQFALMNVKLKDISDIVIVTFRDLKNGISRTHTVTSTSQLGSLSYL